MKVLLILLSVAILTGCACGPYGSQYGYSPYSVSAGYTPPGHNVGGEAIRGAFAGAGPGAVIGLVTGGRHGAIAGALIGGAIGAGAYAASAPRAAQYPPQYVYVEPPPAQHSPPPDECYANIPKGYFDQKGYWIWRGTERVPVPCQ